LKLNTTWKYQQKDKILDFQGKEPIPTKVHIDDRIPERVTKFTYLGYNCHIKEKQT